MNNLPTHLVRALGPPRFAATVLIGLALVTAACSDNQASSITSPPSPLSLSFSKSPSPSGAMLKFAVLAHEAVTCTDGTIIGDVGSFSPPTSVFLSSCPVAGNIHMGDKAAISAYNDFLKTYAALAAQPPCTATLTPAPAQILPPGVYCTVAGITFTDETLTLNGPSNGIWIFRIGTPGTSGTGALSGTNFVVTMAGTARACNVTWWVREGATMTTSNLKGNVLAGAAVTLTGGTFDGSAFAQAAATVTGTAVTAHTGKC